MSEKQITINKIKTWEDLINIIEEVLIQIYPNMTRDEAINKFEAFHTKMNKITEEFDKDDTSHPSIIFLFGAAISFIYNVLIKMHIPYMGKFLIHYDMENLPVKDDEDNALRFIKTMIAVLNMCVYNKDIIDLDQCTFVEEADDSLKENDIKIEVQKISNKNKLN
jgi:hypothetical protein